MIKKLFISLYQRIKTNNQMKTVGQLLKHDFKTKGLLYLYDNKGNLIYYEYSNGYWFKQEYDSIGNRIYFEDSNGYWDKSEYDTKGNVIYYENSNGIIVDYRPKSSCDGKVVEIEGKKYKLTEV